MYENDQKNISKVFFTKLKFSQYTYKYFNGFALAYVTCVHPPIRSAVTPSDKVNNEPQANATGKFGLVAFLFVRE